MPEDFKKDQQTYSQSRDHEKKNNSSPGTDTQQPVQERAWLRDEHELADEQTRSLDEPAEGAND